MRCLFLAMALTLGLAAPALAIDNAVEIGRINALIKAAPPEVADLVKRSLGCAHWGGEEPYDKQRAAQIERALTELKCSRREADEAALRRKYAGSPQAQRALDVLESQVVAP